MWVFAASSGCFTPTTCHAESMVLINCALSARVVGLICFVFISVTLALFRLSPATLLVANDDASVELLYASRGPSKGKLSILHAAPSQGEHNASAFPYPMSSATKDGDTTPKGSTQTEGRPL